MRYLYISILVLITGYFGILNPFKNVLQKMFFPFQFGLRSIAVEIKDSTKLFSNLDNLRKENLSLIEQNLDLQSRVAELKKLSDENALLKDQLGLKKSLDKELLFVSVLGNSADLTGATFIIDKGSSDGVIVGDNIVRGNYMIGIVRAVDSYRSIADYISSSNVLMAVKDLDASSKTEGISEGQYASSILMKRILPTEIIGVGDIIVTSGKDGVFMPGYLVGKVTNVVEVPSETLKSAYLETFINFSKVDQAFVLTR